MVVSRRMKMIPVLITRTIRTIAATLLILVILHPSLLQAETSDSLLEVPMPFTKDELYSMGSQKSYSGDAKVAAFLLGGIGTGNVSIGARGEFRDWELMHHPNKGRYLPFTFFAVRTEDPAGNSVTKVLESQIQPPFDWWGGAAADRLTGLPRFTSSTMQARYPFVQVQLKDPGIPVSAQLEAFTPFVPLDADASGIPAAVLRYTIKNTTSQPLKVSVVGSMANDSSSHLADMSTHEVRNVDGRTGLYFECPPTEVEKLKNGSVALSTTAKDVTAKREWLRGGWWDGPQDFWDDFRDDGRLERESKYVAKDKINPHGWRVGSLAVSEEIAADEEKVFEFILSWHYKNRPNGWWEKRGEATSSPQELVVPNYYATKYKNAWEVAEKLATDLSELEAKSRLFSDTLYASSLPSYIIEALANNITVMRSPTTFRTGDGTFFGWEGVQDGVGSCDGTCTHVWNYAQSQAFLFPELERSARRVEFNVETDDKGKMAFRNRKTFNDAPWDHHAATDGQMGTIIRLYREWKFSGDTEFLRSVWPGAVRALEYAFTQWDSDGDFVLDSQQHNTYDIEFYGPNSLTNSMFYAALKAAAEMADAMGEPDRAEKYRNALALGSAKMDQILWEKDYYVQRLDNVDEYRYQYGIGCLSDQLLGQMLSHVVGLGYILPEEHVKQATHSIYKYNFRESLANHHSVQRGFTFNDEMGLLLASWPRGGRPKHPFVYSDEVWTGIEHQVAAHLIYEGFLDEGLTLVKAVRDRQDGYRRSPWDEIECGHHYARSLSSWALLTALSGFKFDMVKGTVSFDPVINKESFQCFWSTGKAWGIFKQTIGNDGEPVQSIEVLHGDKNAVRLVAN